MNIEFVKELIASLETAPSLSIKEQVYLYSMKEHVALAAENADLKSRMQQLAVESHFHLNGAAHELNTSWMMHKTMLGAQAALLCLSQGDIRSARDWLEGTTDEAFIEMPDDMAPAGLQAWFDSNMTSNDGKNGFLTNDEALEILRQRVPATSAFLASLRAEGIDQWIASRAGRWNGTTKEAEKFAAGLRSQSEQVKGVQS